MLMLRIGALAMILSGVGVYVAGQATDDGIGGSDATGDASAFAGTSLTVTAAVLVIAGVAMLILAKLLSPLLKSSRQISEQSGMKVSRLTGAPTMRSSMAVASERMAAAQAQMAALTGAAAVRRDWGPGSATVKLARDTGQKRNLNPVYEVHLVVAPDAGSAYDAVVETEVNSLAIGQCVPGSVVPVQVNPDDPQDLVVDWLAVAGGAGPS